MKEFVHEVADVAFSIFIFLVGALLFPNFASFLIGFILLSFISFYFKLSLYMAGVFAAGIIILIIICVHKPEYELTRLSLWQRLNKNYKEMHEDLCHKITSWI